MADYQSLYFISLGLDAPPITFTVLFTVNYGLTNLLYYPAGDILHVFSYKLHIV